MAMSEARVGAFPSLSRVPGRPAPKSSLSICQFVSRAIFGSDGFHIDGRASMSLFQTPGRTMLHHFRTQLTSQSKSSISYNAKSHMSSSSLTSHRILQSRPQTLRYHLTRPRQQWQSTKKPTPPNITPELGSPAPQTLSARMKRLSKEYGWSALGVYLALSAIDFPFCYLAVRWLGAERIGRYETAVMGSLWHLVEIPFPNIRQARDGQNDEAREAMPVVKKDNACEFFDFVCG